MALEFHPHQKFAAEWLAQRPKAILAMEQRMGKTPVALRDIDCPTNIIVPAFLKIQWLEELRAWRPDLRATILKPGDVAKSIGGDVWIANYEILQDVQMIGAPGLIVDEGHYCKSHDAKRTITTLALAQRARKVRWLTGTVMPNRSMELWPAMTAVGATTLSAEAFGIRYAGGYIDQWGQYVFRNNTRTDELRELLRPFILRLRREQIGMPPNEWKVIALDLPVDQREKAYSLDAIEHDPRPIAFEGLADLLHWQGRQKLPLALSYVKYVMGERDDFSGARRGLDPVLVFAWHQDVIAEAVGALRAQGYAVESIVGGMSDAARQAVVRRFQAGELDALIGNVKAAGVGLPLHMAERVIFIEGRWTPAEMEQAADRGVSMGRPRSLRVDVLTVHGSIDEYMVRRCLEKSRVIDRVIQPHQEFSQWQNPSPTPSPSPPSSHSPPSAWWRLPCALPRPT
jgi:SWI/SNF-related matrix-associated actin-dependent regulator 1 of chromatin subfamily A